MVVDVQPHAVETDQPLLCAEPAVAVAWLHDGADRVLREAALAVPDHMDVLGDGLAGIEREDIARGQSTDQRGGAREHLAEQRSIPKRHQRLLESSAVTKISAS